MRDASKRAVESTTILDLFQNFCAKSKFYGRYPAKSGGEIAVAGNVQPAAAGNRFLRRFQV